jgi:hypothetical protein
MFMQKEWITIENKRSRSFVPYAEQHGGVNREYYDLCVYDICLNICTATFLDALENTGR